jgi:Na+-driven multidrug efflux pump
MPSPRQIQRRSVTNDNNNDGDDDDDDTAVPYVNVLDDASSEQFDDVEPVPTRRRELRDLLAIAIPIAASMFCGMGMAMTDMAVVGHLGTNELAAVASALIWQTITNVFIDRGFHTAASILISQAFGAKNYKLGTS